MLPRSARCTVDDLRVGAIENPPSSVLWFKLAPTVVLRYSCFSGMRHPWDWARASALYILSGRGPNHVAFFELHVHQAFLVDLSTEFMEKRSDGHCWKQKMLIDVLCSIDRKA
jgi:hypothetical protein